MGRAGRQFRALVWKNWLCRVRHRVSAVCPQGSGVAEASEVRARGWSGSLRKLRTLDY